MPHLLCGLLPVVLAWLGTRRVVGAPLIGRDATVLLDALPPTAGFLLLLLGTGRPVLAALPIVAASAGLALTDRVKRDLLREPVVFADRAELIEVVRHPRLYLPFAGTGLVAGVAALAVAAVAALAWIEPPLFPARPPVWPLLALAGWGCFALPTAPKLLRALARRYDRLPVTRDPATDMARFGMLATFILHATLARAERPERRRLASPAVLRRPPEGAGSIVVLQSESFFDAGRLHPALGDWIPAFNAMRDGAAQSGRLDVPCWGANTVRSEFAALTGITEAMLGLDRFNPYAAFARAPLPSIARHAAACGYETVCVHPFDLRFYDRRDVLPRLGFGRLIGPEAFGAAARIGGWVRDAALAELVADLLEPGGPQRLVFAISMEAHGPYDDTGPVPPLPPGLADLPGAGELARYLARLRGADAALVPIRAALSRAGRGWLALYGDHQPGLPRLFDALGMADPRTDYLFWTPRAGGPDTRGVVRDLSAHELGRALFDRIAA